MSISLYHNLRCQMVFPTVGGARIVPQTIALAIVATSSSGWLTQPWPGTMPWPFSPRIPKLLFGQFLAVASDGQGWLLSKWPGRGAWPYTRASKTLRGQYAMQWAQKTLNASVTMFLNIGQTNLGSNNTKYCGRDYCSSGVYVANAWMFKSLFQQATCALMGQHLVRCSVITPKKVSYALPNQYFIENPVDRVGPFNQIYLSPIELNFNDKLLGGQYWAERSSTMHSQWKKRPF